MLCRIRMPDIGMPMGTPRGIIRVASIAVAKSEQRLISGSWINKKARADTPPGRSRFSTLFNVAAIGGNRPRAHRL